MYLKSLHLGSVNSMVGNRPPDRAGCLGSGFARNPRPFRDSREEKAFAYCHAVNEWQPVKLEEWYRRRRLKESARYSRDASFFWGGQKMGESRVHV